MKKNGLHIDNKGTKRWYLNDMLHREDGPAEEWGDGIVAWYLNDTYFGDNAVGFWHLWDQLSIEQQDNLNLHTWLAKYSI